MLGGILMNGFFWNLVKAFCFLRQPGHVLLFLIFLEDYLNGNYLQHFHRGGSWGSQHSATVMLQTITFLFVMWYYFFLWNSYHLTSFITDLFMRLLSSFRRRQWHPTPVLLSGKSHGQRSLVGCSPWGREELDTTEWLHFHFSLSCIGEGNGNPLQCSCLENPRDGRAWWAAIYGVTQSQTQLKWLSSSSSSSFNEDFDVCLIAVSLQSLPTSQVLDPTSKPKVLWPH